MISYWTILLRLLLAILFGSIIGLEREQKERGAGMRTLALVTAGSTLFTIVSAYGFLDLLSLNEKNLTLDPTKIASYIVAGIGFLGAGTIFMSREKEKVKGLTTAASIWVMAAVGIACGAGLLWEAATTTLLTLIVLVVFQQIEDRLVRHVQTGIKHIHLETSSIEGDLLSTLYAICARNHITIERIRIQSENDRSIIGLLCEAAPSSSLSHALLELQKLPGVLSIQMDQNDTGEGSYLLSKQHKDGR
ncbi:MAG TPA: MgtC/SapB family protein [Ktedonobacteraceae bacterium]|nr:MgtC/SapB family protein [Ktedonobacteraceae bacterium]